MGDSIPLVTIEVTVNGQKYCREVEPRLLLVEFLRENLDLTGTHIGCDTSYCGACTVRLNGDPIKSCTLFAVQADGCEVLTVESLEKEGELHPLQKSFSEHHALQCGYCTPGMLMSAQALLDENPHADRKAIRKAIAGNVCRCTGYQNIIKAIEAVANGNGESKSWK
ncbi:MAG: carbon monoxide dehydrogenase [Afipia sp. 64-13]|nr:MAG: carbon monoxide dehydrogenase [Afipia sp. 64-13]